MGNMEPGVRLLMYHYATLALTGAGLIFEITVAWLYATWVSAFTLLCDMRV